jgi:hypothetical protein
MTVAKFRFRRRSFEEHTILDSDGRVIGHLRVKPNAIWWKSAGTASWHGVGLAAFARYAQRAGVRKRGRRAASRARDDRPPTAPELSG